MIDMDVTYESKTRPRMPEAVEQIVASVFEQAKVLVADDGELMPVAFLIQIDTGAFMPMGLPFHDDKEKHMAMMALRAMAKKMQSDCVIFMCEAWGASATAKNADEARAETKRIAQTGNVRNQPGAYECLMINVETYNGNWIGMAKLVRDGKTRSFERPAFKYMRGGEGMMMGYLPPRGTMQ